jgi:hypothetical protein
MKAHVHEVADCGRLGPSKQVQQGLVDPRRKRVERIHQASPRLQFKIGNEAEFVADSAAQQDDPLQVSLHIEALGQVVIAAAWSATARSGITRRQRHLS